MSGSLLASEPALFRCAVSNCHSSVSEPGRRCKCQKSCTLSPEDGRLMDGLTFNLQRPRGARRGGRHLWMRLSACRGLKRSSRSGNQFLMCKAWLGPCAPQAGIWDSAPRSISLLSPNLHPELGVFLSAWGYCWQGTSQGDTAPTQTNRIPEPACPQSPFPSALPRAASILNANWPFWVRSHP